jgi:hypothetical protein
VDGGWLASAQARAKESDAADGDATIGGVMKNQSTPSNNVTSPFVAKHASDVIGNLSGFDRLRLRGTLRSLYQPSVLLRYLFLCQVMLKGFKNYSLSLTKRILDSAQEMANQAGRPWEYLNSTRISKEDWARQIARRDHVEQGLVAILRCVEPCQTYEVRGIRPFLKDGKCMHLYFYHQHPLFGFMHFRLQTWFPFQVEVCLNGREWLARQMDKVGLSYQRQDNYFPWIAQLPKAQGLMDQQLQTHWLTHLQGLLNQNHPLHQEICRPLEWQYYWTCCESEYATDVMFQDPARLASLYPRLVQHALLSFGSTDVLRFLGRNVPLTGNSKFDGQVITDLKLRPEGLRIKHRVNRNSLKMYDKFARGLRVETTINQCEDFQVFRHPEGRPDQPKQWRALRRGLADLHRRAQISKAANDRYLLALASVDDKTPLRQLAGTLCRPIKRKGTRYRALNPWSPLDGALLEAINRGEFAINGLRNRDLRVLLFPANAPAEEQHRRAGRVSRLLALLRAHGILRKVPRSHRYHLTKQGRTVVTALLTARQADTEQLTKLAA